MNRYRNNHLLIAIVLLLAATLSSFAQPSTNRPAGWAQPVIVPGVTNCYEVTTNLYRGAQPTVEGMKRLKAMGIKTIVNLRAFHSDDNKVAGAGLKDVRFEMYPWHGDEDDVVKFLKVATDTNDLPVFVHCERGADRTGMMCAMYRIVVCGWTKQQAIDEMKHGGFRFSPVWDNLITFIQKADIDEIKRRAGLK
ncbi:MAG TPA: tyrosine-protein phosphatase [Verrucomicrobiae bacterium]|jgi:protein tyrosine/serine phosphatase